MGDSMLDTPEKVEQWLIEGGTIECADCPKEISKEDEYVFLAGYVFCKECFEE